MKTLSLTRLSSDALQKRQMDAIKGGNSIPTHPSCYGCFCPTDSEPTETIHNDGKAYYEESTTVD